MPLTLDTQDDAHLATELHRLSQLALQALAQRQAQPQQSQAARVIQALEQRGALWQTSSMSELAEELRHRLPPPAPRHHGKLPALVWLQRRFSLDPVSYWLLTCALAPVFSEEIARGYSVLSGRTDHSHLDLHVFTLLLDWHRRQGSARLAAFLRPDAPLLRHSLVEVDRDSRSNTIVVIRPTERVLAFIAHPGLDLDHALMPFCTLHPVDPSPDISLPAATVTHLEALEGEGPLSAPLLITGRTGSGRRSVARRLAASRAQTLLELRFDALLDNAVALTGLGARVAREARLLGASLLLSGVRSLLPAHSDDPEAAERVGQARVLALRSVMREVLRLAEEPPFLVGDLRVQPGSLSHALDTPVLSLVVEQYSNEERARLWDRFLPTGLRAPDLDLDRLVLQHRLQPRSIESAASAALEESARRGDGLVGMSLITSAIRQDVRRRLSSLVRTPTTTMTWSDLVVSDETQLRLRSLISSHRHARQVYERWGLNRYARHHGIVALFSGSPGTGKTLAATLLAQELEMPLFQVDLAGLVSKYIGETEKNLERLFDDADAVGAMLLFDEADAIFGKRVKVKNSSDRYANMATNYLLQRLESFDGVAVLTTNLPGQIDEAFSRRIRFNVPFDKPNEELRLRLWRGLLPKEVPTAEDVNFKKLASYEMSGGLIKNTIIQAAFLAADLGREVDQRLLMVAVNLELRNQGHAVRGLDLGEYLKELQDLDHEG